MGTEQEPGLGLSKTPAEVLSGAQKRMGWLHPMSKPGFWDPVVFERGQSFGNLPRAIRLVNGRGREGMRRKLPGCLQKEVQEPGWRWDHSQGKKIPGPATGLLHQLPGAYETEIEAQPAPVTKDL